MSKLKTSASISKRFKVTATRKLLRRHACKSHLLEKKSHSRKKRLSKPVLVNKSEMLVLKQKLYL
uniref:Large ribosomal subunit protein bL35c n=1 Tax=Liagoropsis maxima TaxID=1653392 RepID=A0A1G4NVX3_9FLOR|nr:Ribosomal protein L35 [Liagoropsis maxima]SCW22797.1 Ribosomal protein L35 [Liagoropsis maxima]